MPSLPRLACRLTTSAAAGLLAVTAAVVPGAATAATPRTSITVFLSAPDPAGLTALAAAHGLSRSRRLSALARLVPDDARHRAAETALRRAGLTVTSETAWSLTASGTTETVASRFGRPASAVADQLATAPLPTLPAGLADIATAAFPTDTGPAAYHPATRRRLAGSDFRNAYTSPSVSPPYSGAGSSSGLTIATLQLGGWNSADLQTYATDHHLTLAPGQYKGFDLDDVKTSDTSDDGEVALDQESLLSTDPAADQRAYFAPNTDAGFTDVFAQVYDDVTQDSHASSDGGDPHIAALSVSYGSCEQQTTTSSIRALEPILASLQAAGVTVLAATGDDGIYDCGQNDNGSNTTTSDVNYPASSPFVVAVGGTRLESVGTSAPNTGSNWTETGWTCRTPSACESSDGSGGSGGGASGTFAAPAYQKVTIRDAPFAGSTQRLLPDIAANGDPETGFTIYTSDTSDNGCSGSHTCGIGGTSLATPVSAALLTDLLAHEGRTAGVGDVHAAIYSAYRARAGAFRDVTSGSNGRSGDRGDDPAVTAQAGYDTVTGTGAALWPALAPYLFDPEPPTVTATMALTSPHSRTHPRRVTAVWSVRQSAPGLAGRSATVTVYRVGSAKPVYTATRAATGSHVFTGRAGSTYRLRVTGTDLAGTPTVTPATATTAVPVDDASFTFHGHWTRASGRADDGGSHATTAVTGAYARVSGTGRTYRLRVRTSPTSGRLGVFRHGRRLATIDLYSASTGHRTVTIYGSASGRRSARTFTLRDLGTKASGSRGRRVQLDALVVVS